MENFLSLEYTMAYRRRGRGRGRKPMRRRKYGGVRRIRRTVPNVHRFKEVYQLPVLAVNANSTSNGVMSFNLDALLNSSSFENLYDLYKITGVKIRMLYRHNASNPADGAAVSEFPTLYIAPNRNPMVPPPVSVSDILNDDGIKILRADKLTGKGGLYLKDPKPDMSSVVTSGGTPTGGIVTQQWNFGVSNKFQPWLTTGGNGQSLNQSTVPHFGYRWYLENLGCNVAQNIQVFATLYFSCKEQD